MLNNSRNSQRAGLLERMEKLERRERDRRSKSERFAWSVTTASLVFSAVLATLGVKEWLEIPKTIADRANASVAAALPAAVRSEVDRRIGPLVLETIQGELQQAQVDLAQIDAAKGQANDKVKQIPQLLEILKWIHADDLNLYIGPGPGGATADHGVVITYGEGPSRHHLQLEAGGNIANYPGDAGQGTPGHPEKFLAGG